MADTSLSTARRHYWRQQIEAWQVSGQSQRAFCEAHDLNYPRFGYWLRKFRQQATRQENDKPTGFVPVTQASPMLTDGLSLVLPNGLQLRGIAADNLSLVHQLLNHLS